MAQGGLKARPLGGIELVGEQEYVNSAPRAADELELDPKPRIARPGAEAQRLKPARRHVPCPIGAQHDPGCVLRPPQGEVHDGDEGAQPFQDDGQPCQPESGHAERMHAQPPDA